MFRPQLFATGDRTPDSAGSMFVSLDRTPHERTPLTSANVLPSSLPMTLSPMPAVTSREHRHAPST
ncbi:hypothetical protein, partial [Actinoallomurus iriomotensis]|uniref:hypothetical protein n=1 Tax=Actinoallomurus iriomotensis TaxID=478107 RepID=UPI002552295B